MKHLLVFIFILNLSLFPSIAQESEEKYEEMWSAVEQLMKDGRTSSALEEVEKIEKQAEKDKLVGQKTKALIHIMKLKAEKDEDAFLDALKNLEDRIHKATGIEKALLHSAAAEMYWWYYQNHSYEIWERLPDPNNQNPDIRTCDANQMVGKIDEHYWHSLEPKEELIKAKPVDISAVLTSKKDELDLRPSLYDFLVHRAIDFYTSNISGLTYPKDQFYIDDIKYFSDVDEFAILSIPEPNYLSLDYKALVLYQKLLKIHQTEENKLPSLFADLERIKFVYGKYSGGKKDELYEQALKSLIERSEKTQLTLELKYELAQFYFNKGSGYDRINSPEYRYHKKKAFRICQEVVNKYAASRGTELCRSLLQQIDRKSLSVQIESVLLPEEEHVILVKYQNVQEVHFRLLEIPKEIFQLKPERRMSGEVQQYLGRQPLHEWSQSLPDSGDFQPHSAEVDVKALNSGYYLLITSLDKDFKTAENILSSNRFYVSDWAYFFESGNQEKTEFYVVNRKSGKPLKEVQVNRYVENYNYQKRVTQYNEAGTFSTNSDGKISFQVEGDSKAYHLLLVGKNDSVKVSSAIYLRESNRQTKALKKSQIFTDRSIYRPGQNLYFKGVKWSQEQYELKLLQNEKVTVNLIDVNGQKISTLHLETNEFGTYQGVFALPGSGLTGRFTIEDGNTRQTINIEEYKRPNFTVSTQPVEGVISFNSVVSLQGKAEQFNGLALSNAKGSFRVTRENHSIYYRYYWFPRPASNKTEILYGEFETDEKGEFTIEFNAIPDGKRINDENYNANFSIEISITDINGETQETKTQVKVGKKSMYLEIGGDEKLTSTELPKGVKIGSYNLQGQELPTEVEVQLFSLKKPDKPILPRQWSDAEYNLSANKEDVSPGNVPDNALSNLIQLEVSEHKQTVKINTAETDIVRFEKVEEGPYIIIAKATDPAGYEIEEEKRLLVYSESGATPMPFYLWTYQNKEEVRVGEKIEFSLADFRKSAPVKYRIWNKHGLQYDSWVSAGPKGKKIEYEIKEEDRGQVLVQLFTVADNRQFSEELLFNVPYDNKKLDISLESFKDEMKPGDKETWKITVTKKLLEVQKETDILVSMYDLSLDEIKNHQWSLNPYQFGVRKRAWLTGNNFSAVSSRQQNFFQWSQFEPGYRQFHQLNWFGYHYYGPYSFYELEESVALSADGLDGAANKSAEPIPPVKLGRYKTVKWLEDEKPAQETVVRDDFRETAFFYPELVYDVNGLASFSFDVPDALTAWKFQAIALSKEFEYGYLCDTFVTKKEIETKLNLPRFLTAGDEILIKAKVSNLTDTDQLVSVQLMAKDKNGKDVSDILSPQQNELEVSQGGSNSASWKLKVMDYPGYFGIYF